jgi:hypothetical protein
MRRVVFILALAAAGPLGAQVPDSTCLIVGRAARDSLARLHLRSVRDSAGLTAYQQRAFGSLSAILSLKCVSAAPPPGDTTTPPNPDPVTVALSIEGGDTLRIRPVTPYMLFFRVAVDSGGATISDSAAFTLSDTSLARSFWNRTARRLEVYTLTTHTKSGALTITARHGAVNASRTIMVSASTPAPGPIDTTPPPAPPPVSDSTALGILTQLIGPTRTAADAQARGLGGLDSLFRRWEPVRWAADSTAGVNGPEGLWAATNYYDRAMIYYAYWARTGNPLYRSRADQIALSYRRQYIEKNNYNHALWWWMPDGLALHYRYTGDTMSLRAVAQGTRVLEGYFARMPNPADVNIDGRNRARLLQSYLLSWQLGAPNLVPGVTWAQRLDSMLVMLEKQQRADGAWVDANRCYTQAAFLGAMQAEQLTRVYDHYRQDPRILAMVRKQLDFLWPAQVIRPATGPLSFAYVNEDCPSNGDYHTTPAPDLNGFFPHMFAWYGTKSGDRTYTAIADTLLKATIRGIYPQGSKQFNQAFALSWLTLAHLP